MEEHLMRDLPPRLCRFAVLVLFSLPLVTGCTGDNPAVPGNGELSALGSNKDAVVQDGSLVPDEPVDASFPGTTLTLWPWTSSSLDTVKTDPVDLIFVGKADPVRIRAALLALSPDRSGYPLPFSVPVEPFTSVWSDAAADVQTTWVEGEGWTGSVVQLQLGDYGPLRVHVRLFSTGIPWGDGGTITLGAAHFEFLIPGTSEHQVLSWELAERLVVLDLARTGLLDTSAPVMVTNPINDAPTYRTIDPMIYNLLPEELKQLFGGPAGQVAEPVGIATDGRATVLNLAQAAPIVAGTASYSFTVPFGQMIPKPFCNESGFEYFFLAGPLLFTGSVTVDEDGNYSYHKEYSGMLEATPVDPTGNPPMPIGEPFKVRVTGTQNGLWEPGNFRVTAIDRRVAPEGGGTELFLSRIQVGNHGQKSFRSQVHCLSDPS
jgi:hypothetical protein